MNIIKYPSREQWAEIIERPHLDVTQLNQTVAAVLADVRQRGDEAVKGYELKFDHVDLDILAVSDEEMAEAETLVSAELREAIPGGTAPLFSTVLMLATPAKIAGCSEIVLCTPPDRQGRVNPAILVAARIAGVSHIYKIGGVQAIGAMAYGTETVPKVYKIFGPGNQYVMAAKQQVSLHDVAIDMPAGPSEVCVIADEMANPAFVAADLLSQAEHGADSQVILITTSHKVIDDVQQEVDRQLDRLPRKEIVQRSLQNSLIILVRDKKEAIELSNAYAPEHLVIQTEDYETMADHVVNAGSVFLGRYACESAGDYASGTNHTLPTHGYATAYNGVNLDSYCRKVTFQHLSEEGVRSIGRAVELMAEAEQLDAHKNAMTVRMVEIENKSK